MFRRYMHFIRGVSVNLIGKIGVIVTTSAFVTFVVLELARLAGILANAYIGLITYLLFPALFVIGLLLIPIGWRQYKRRTGLTLRELMEGRFEREETSGSFFGSRLFASIAVFTLANVLFLFGASSRMLHFMDEPRFCGTACHSVMNPEWVTYQQSPHARVKCVECHVGEGVDALVDSKLNGMWQMISITFDLLERPIPTPVHQLRPARETCEKCHWPDKFYGRRLKEIVHYGDDSAATPLYTTLSLKVDAGRYATERGIHWHIAHENAVRYASVDDEREEMIWVEVRRPDGSYRRYMNRRLSRPTAAHEYVRTMDCVDCHNRATHVYERPDDAVDQRLRLGMIDRTLPYIRREALAALRVGVSDSALAHEAIANHLTAFYQQHYPDLMLARAEAVDSAINVLRGVYSRNVHHGMNITWGTYPSLLGHRDNSGCFRCHNGHLVAEDGMHVDNDCALCHSILAYDSRVPYEFLQEPDTTDPNYDMHRYLRNEFMGSLDAGAGRMSPAH